MTKDAQETSKTVVGVSTKLLRGESSRRAELQGNPEGTENSDGSPLSMLSYNHSHDSLRSNLGKIEGRAFVGILLQIVITRMIP